MKRVFFQLQFVFFILPLCPNQLRPLGVVIYRLFALRVPLSEIIYIAVVRVDQVVQAGGELPQSPFRRATAAPAVPTRRGIGQLLSRRKVSPFFHPSRAFWHTPLKIFPAPEAFKKISYLKKRRGSLDPQAARPAERTYFIFPIRPALPLRR